MGIGHRTDPVAVHPFRLPRFFVEGYLALQDARCNRILNVIDGCELINGYDGLIKGEFPASSGCLAPQASL